ncbi:MAG: hypothetical protein AB7D38_12335 [Sulfurimonas sp.]|uniref:hypothetical protein n=1 Tax=Sulfurimonas sp. TaxID=2022749 RepID=UPI003D12320A
MSFLKNLREIKISSHFLERAAQRFSDDDLKKIEKTVKKAIEKAIPGEKIKYTHPEYGVTVVIRKMGRVGGELITCWK